MSSKESLSSQNINLKGQGTRRSILERTQDQKKVKRRRRSEERLRHLDYRQIDEGLIQNK